MGAALNVRSRYVFCTRPCTRLGASGNRLGVTLREVHAEEDRALTAGAASNVENAPPQAADEAVEAAAAPVLGGGVPVDTAGAAPPAQLQAPFGSVQALSGAQRSLQRGTAAGRT